MVINAGLVIDLGNSETRAILLAGNKSSMFFASNKFAELSPSYKYPSQYVNDKSFVFKNDNIYFANGQIVEREFLGQEIRPVAIEKKTDQKVTTLSLNLVIMKSMLELSKQYGVAISDLDVTFNISVLLPPLEHEVNEDRLKNLIKGLGSIQTLVPESAIMNFKVGEVNVYPEGVAAFFGALFKEEGGELVEVAENTPYTTGYTLVIDIGAGTSDVVLIKDSELVLNSKDTFEIGGNTVDSYVVNECKKVYGFTPQKATDVVMTCLLTEGVKTHEIEGIVTDAKENYSKLMMGKIRGYLEGMALPVRELKGILIVGGGSVASIRNGQVVSPAMSDVLMKYFKTLAPHTEMVSLGSVSPREINIIGLKYMHKYA